VFVTGNIPFGENRKRNGGGVMMEKGGIEGGNGIKRSLTVGEGV
jgi:hypothetical protein